MDFPNINRHNLMFRQKTVVTPASKDPLAQPNVLTPIHRDAPRKDTDSLKSR